MAIAARVKTEEERPQPFHLPDLLYPMDSFEPFMSARTFEVHHGKHHRGYVDKLNELVAGTHYETMGLEEIVRTTHDLPEAKAIFNNAAQHLNHSKFWLSMRPNGGGPIPPNLSRRLTAEFGSIRSFKAEFIAQGLAQFGSGWVWLVAVRGRLQIERTANAMTPVAQGHTPLLACDLWEHAYYLDYANRRADFLKEFLDHMVDWQAVAAGRVAAPV
jgi:Fe-Mn family superoxide dismutase